MSSSLYNFSSSIQTTLCADSLAPMTTLASVVSPNMNQQISKITISTNIYFIHKMETEYRRYLVASYIKTLMDDISMGLIGEAFMMDMIIHEEPTRIDPVLIKLTMDHHLIKEMDSLTSLGITEAQITKYKLSVISKLDEYFDWLKSNSKEPEQEIYVHKGIDMITIIYKDTSTKIPLAFYNMIKHIYKGKPENFIYDLARSGLRYKSAAPSLAQGNLDISYYEYLYKQGYKYELASPFNFMFGLVEYQLTGKITTVGFHSVFPDIDSIFGCLEPIKRGFKPRPWTLYYVHYSWKFKDLMNELFLHFNISNIIYISSCKQQYSEGWIELIIPNMVKENNVKYGTTIHYTYYLPTYVYYKSKTPLTLSSSEVEYINQPQLQHEWNRLLHIEKIKALNTNTSAYYPALTELFICMSLLNSADSQAADQIFIDLRADHDIYLRFKTKLQIANIPDLTSEVRTIIKSYLASPKHQHKVLYRYDMNGLRYESNGQVFRYDVKLLKIMTLKYEAQANEHHESLDHLALTGLRYLCLVSSSVQPMALKQYTGLLYNHFGIHIEGYTSPFDSNLININKIKNVNLSLFYSLFYDTDQYFGGIKNLADLQTRSDIRLIVTIPTIEPLAKKILHELEQLTKHTSFLYFIYCPLLDIDYEFLDASPHIIAKRIMQEEQYYCPSINQSMHAIYPDKPYVLTIMTNISTYTIDDFKSLLD
jgi:hypothetical protein